MSVDLSNLSLVELNEVIQEARALIAEKQEEAVQAAYQKVIIIASEVGLSAEELLRLGRDKAVRPVSRGVVPPRYRNPTNPAETWTGRGKSPRWVQDKIARGITLEDMLIK